MILRRQKAHDRKSNVLFINGETLFRHGRNQNTLEPQHASTLLAAYAAFTDEPGLAAVATLDDIASNGYNLNIPLYVEPIRSGDEVTLERALADLEAAHRAARETRAALDVELAKWGLGPVEVNL